MKTHTIIFSIILVAIVTFAGCVNQSEKAGDSNTQASTGKVVYTCPMHPEIQSDKPGSCPKCGMTLVKKEVSVDTTHNMTADSMSTMQNK
jgi:hypothetical protein